VIGQLCSIHAPQGQGSTTHHVEQLVEGVELPHLCHSLPGACHLDLRCLLRRAQVADCSVVGCVLLHYWPRYDDCGMNALKYR
jgi:hypothetical protein